MSLGRQGPRGHVTRSNGVKQIIIIITRSFFLSKSIYITFFLRDLYFPLSLLFSLMKPYLSLNVSNASVF